MKDQLPNKLSEAMDIGPTSYESEDRVIIALDFGTTFSGVAYAFCNPGKKAEVIPILDWPGQKGYRQPKIPTVILYDPDDLTKFQWGGQVGWRTESVQGVKLLLDPDQQRPFYLPTGNIKNEIKKLPKEPLDVAADFIGAIYNHALSKIESASVKEYFQLCQKQFVLSVPAVWSDKAKDKTLRAAKKAGIHPVTLIKEPEAAALYTLFNHERALHPGDAFVVCDAGGGTVDLITYKVVAISPSLELKELVAGSGGMAGSFGLNQRFEEAVHNLVGDEQWIELKKSVGWAKALNDFDKQSKIAFKGDSDEDFFINFPKAKLEDNPDENLVSNCWTMSGTDMKGIFDPLVTDILRLIDEQVKSALLKRQGKELKGIFLVGGFGASQYLKACVTKAHPDVQVIQPDDAWAAIVNRMPNQAVVTSTQATRHYGVSAKCMYEPATDKGRKTMIDKFDGKTRNTWYIYMGEELKRDQTIRFPFSRCVKLGYRDSELIFYDELLASDSKTPPTHPGEDAKVSCTLTSDLRKVPKSEFVKRRGVNGIEYYQINFDLVISTVAANMKFSLERAGKEMGSVDARYE
ncbi:actin-like ATPase domain-containing protein [Whalleya microplaca]|nr:actin-like ATPase domain-containing protein [Whalleya microplaca]